MALGSEVVDLVRAQIIEERGERTAVGQVGIVEKKPRIGLVEVLVDVVEPSVLKLEARRFRPWTSYPLARRNSVR